jgi:hypothetical protein
MSDTKGLSRRKSSALGGEKMIPYTLALQPRHLVLLRKKAADRGVSIAVVLREVLDEWVEAQQVPLQPEPGTGAELVAELTANGFIGAWEDRTDIGDSSTFARRLRERAQMRADRSDGEEIRRRKGAHPAGQAEK